MVVCIEVVMVTQSTQIELKTDIGEGATLPAAPKKVHLPPEKLLDHESGAAKLKVVQLCQGLNQIRAKVNKADPDFTNTGNEGDRLITRLISNAVVDKTVGKNIAEFYELIASQCLEYFCCERKIAERSLSTDGGCLLYTSDAADE